MVQYMIKLFPYMAHIIINIIHWTFATRHTLDHLWFSLLSVWFHKQKIRITQSINLYIDEITRYSPIKVPIQSQSWEQGHNRQPFGSFCWTIGNFSPRNQKSHWKVGTVVTKELMINQGEAENKLCGYNLKLTPRRVSRISDLQCIVRRYKRPNVALFPVLHSDYRVGGSQ